MAARQHVEERVKTIQIENAGKLLSRKSKAQMHGGVKYKRAYSLDRHFVIAANECAHSMDHGQQQHDFTQGWTHVRRDDAK